MKRKIRQLNSFFLALLKQQQGIALLMAMGAITLLLAVIIDFTLETKINKLRAYNSQERVQAKLNAESGLTLSMARLSLYTEALNLLEKKSAQKKLIPQQLLDLIWSIPIVFPIPLPAEANIIQKEALEEFQENTFLAGKISVVIENISNQININLLRLNKSEKEIAALGAAEGGEDSALAGKVLVQEKLTKILKDKLQQKRDDLDDFSEVYGDYEADYLIAAIKYFINDQRAYEDEHQARLESHYQDTRPKFAPLSGRHELHLIRPLKDAHWDLIKNQVSVHGNNLIDLNKITLDGLKFLLPDLTEEAVADFFTYRDDPEEPHFFNTVDDFKSYFTTQARILTDSDLSKRFEELEKSGLRFGPTGSLFKVTSTGQFNKARVTIVATVEIPVEFPTPPPNKKTLDGRKKCPSRYEFDKDAKDKSKPCRAKRKKDKSGRPLPLPLVYSPPKVVEMEVN